MSRRKIPPVILSVLLLTTLLTAGCTQSGAAPRRSDESNTLYVGEVVQAFPTSFLPWQSRDGVDPTISGLLFDSLSPHDEQTGTFLPGVAREWYFVDENDNPIVTADGEIDYDRLEEIYGSPDKHYIPVKFILYENATWSDGAPLTVEDVYFTFDLAANYELSQHAGALVWVNDIQHTYTDGKLVRQGIFTYDRGAAEAGHTIPESQKDTVIYFHINKVLGAVTPLTSTVLILPQHVIGPIISPEKPLVNREPTDEQIAAYSNPVGSGPYTLDRANTNAQQVTLVRRDDYYIRGADGGYYFKSECIKFLLYQDVNVAIYALKKGHIDVLDTQINADYVNLFGDDEGVEVMQAPALFVDTLVLNMNAPPDKMTPMRELLAMPDFRRAIALCIDQNELVDKVLNGTGVAYSQGLVGERQAFYNPASCLIQGGTEAEINEANALLDTICPERGDDGYRMYQGKRVLFEILGLPTEQTTISYLQVQFQRIGVDVQFKAKGANPENTYLYAGDFDMTIQKISLTETNIDMMADSHFVNLNKSSNYGRHMDSEFADLVSRMRGTLNRNYKYELAGEIQTDIALMYYKIPLFSSDVLSAYRTDRYTNFQVYIGQRALNQLSLRNLVRVS